MGDNRGVTIAWLIRRLDGVERLLQKIAPKYRLMDGDVLTLPDAAVQRTPAQPASAPSWASLPPIQRTAGSMPLVAAPGDFAGALPGTQGLPPIVQPLGHEVSSLATPGLVVARALPVEVAGSGSMPAPAQRRASRPARSSAATAAPSPMPASEPEAVDHDAHDHAPLAAAPVAPIRRMPTVSRQAVRVPDRPLTNASSAAQPAAVQPAAAAVAAESAGAGAATPPASGGMRRVPKGLPVARPVVSRQASAAADHADHAVPGAPAPASPPARSGVGEPMTSLPASARPLSAPAPVASRWTTAGPMPIVASSLRSPVQRSAGAAAEPQLALGPGSQAATVASAASSLPALPQLPVARSRSGAGSASPAAARASVQASASPARPEIRPIAGGNPIHTSIPLQRDAADDSEDEPGGDASLPSPWWGSGDSAVRPGATGLGVDAGVTSIQRSRADDPAVPFLSSFGAPAGRTPVQHIAGPGARSRLPALELPHPAGQARAAGADPDGGRRTLSFPAAASGAPSVQTSVMRASPPLSAGLRSAGPSDTVQRAGTVDLGPAAATPATPAGPAATPAAPAMTAGAEAEAGSAGPAGPESAGRSEKDLDELAQALFGRIRGRLRSDLIYDREAKGLTFDNV